MSRHAIFIIHCDPALRSLYARELTELGDVDLVVVNCGGYSSAYTAESSRMVDSLGRRLPKFLAKYGPNSSRPPSSVSIVTFSAGYALARGLLAHPDDRASIDAYVALDSIHAGFAAPGVPIEEQLRAFVEYAKLAASGQRLFWLLHSDVKTPQKGTAAFASTTQVAQALTAQVPLSGNWLVRSVDERADDKEEHSRVLTDLGPRFVSDALVPYLRFYKPKERATNEVERVVTPIGQLELAAVLRDGHTAALGSPPSTNRLACGWAQIALETGRGKSVNCHNLGNITAGKSWPGQFFWLKVPPPDPPTLKFRAYPHWLDGAADYWRLLSTRYSTALEHFDAGSPIKAAAELSRLKYFLAPLAHYAKGMDSLHKEFMSKILPKL